MLPMPTYTTLNPATGQALHTYELLSDEAIARALSAASKAFLKHRETPVAVRADKMLRLKDGRIESVRDGRRRA